MFFLLFLLAFNHVLASPDSLFCLLAVSHSLDKSRRRHDSQDQRTTSRLEGIQECENSGQGMTANLSHRATP